MAFELADRELGTNPPSRPTTTSRLLPTPNGKRLESGPRVHHNRAAGRRPVPTRTMVPLRITIPVSSLPALHHSMNLGGSDELHLSLAHSNEQRATSLAPGPTYPSRGPPRTRIKEVKHPPHTPNSGDGLHSAELPSHGPARTTASLQGACPHSAQRPETTWKSKATLVPDSFHRKRKHPPDQPGIGFRLARLAA